MTRPTLGVRLRLVQSLFHKSLSAPPLLSQCKYVSLFIRINSLYRRFELAVKVSFLLAGSALHRVGGTLVSKRFLRL